MTQAAPEEIGATDLGTSIQDPDLIYVALANQPPLNTQIITAHRTLAGANQQLESHAAAWGVDPRDVGIVEQLPLLP